MPADDAAAGGPVEFTRIPVGVDSDQRGRIRSTNRRLAILLAGIAAALMAAATWMYASALRAGEAEALRRLQTFNMLRHDAVEDFFRNHENEVRVWAENRELGERARRVFADWDAMGEGEKRTVREHLVRDAALPSPTPAQASYLARVRRITPNLLAFIEHHDFYDLFLFAPDGELAFTVVREDDFGLDYTDPDNPYHGTGLGEVARTVRAGGGLPAVSDFEPYAPSGGTMEAFIAEPLPGEDSGVLAIQLSFVELNEVLAYNSGLGETGRTLLVGADRRIRNDPELLGGDVELELDTEAVEAALAGETFLGQSTGERGNAVLVAAQPLDFHDLRWAVLTEQDREEVVAPLAVYRRAWLAALLGITLTALAMYGILRLRW